MLQIRPIKSVLIYAMSLCSITWGMAIPASARSYSPATTQTTHLLNQQANLTFPPTEDRGAPSRTRGSGSRGPCGDGSDSALSDIALTALMPANNIGTTISSHPAVYVYVPKTSGKSAEFTLYNWTTRERAAVYEAQVPVANLSGIVKIPLPETVNLEPENTYVWVFSIVCNAQDRSQDQYVSGWIERVSLKSDQQATIEDTQQPSEKAALYASAGIWHETLEILEQLRSTDPQIWRTFLDSVGLGEISEQQVIECCQSQSSL